MMDRFKDYIFDKKFTMNIFENKINIVNYIDIITLEDTRISIKYEKGILVIRGNNLSVNKLLDGEILITGDFKQIELEWWNV